MRSTAPPRISTATTRARPTCSRRTPAAPKSRRAPTTGSAARSAAPSSRTRRSSWDRTSACRTTRSRPSRRRCRPSACATATSPSCSPPAHPDLQPVLGAAGERRRHPRSVPGQYHPAEPAESDRPERPQVLPAAQPGGRRRYDQQLLRRAAVDLRLRLPDGASRHQWNAPNRTYVRWTRNFRREERDNWAGEQNGFPITQGSTDRSNLNVALGHTAILSNDWFIDLKGSYLKFHH